MFIFLSRALRSLAPSPMFSKRTKRKIKQHLCTGYFHTVKRMSAPDEAQKMLCIIASLEFFSCVSTRRLLFHHNCPVGSVVCFREIFMFYFPNQKFEWSGESRYPGALAPVLENFRRAFFLDPTDCPWVSKDELRLIRSGTCSVYYPCSSLCSQCLERTV